MRRNPLTATAVLLAALAAAPCAAADRKQKITGPAIDLNTTEWNFGRVKEGAMLKYTFKVKNIGTENLVIESVTPSCKCTLASVDSEIRDKILRPGRSTKISLSYDTNGHRGQISNYVFIKTNDPKRRSQIFYIKGDIEMQFPEVTMYYTSEPINVVQPKKGETSLKAIFKNMGMTELNIAGASTSSPQFEVVMDTGVIPNNQKSAIYLKAKPGTLQPGTTQYIHLDVAIPFYVYGEEK